MQKNRQRACFGTSKGLSSAQGGDWSTLVKLGFLSLFANYCPLLKTVYFWEDIFCLFPYSLLIEQHIVLFDVCA